MFPTGMFETATQRKILRVLAEKNKRYTIDELAAACHRSEASISRALRRANRYPFIEKDRVSGSKQLTFRLAPESQYSAAIRDFFRIERDQERQNGTVPVDVWNLLEDVADQFSTRVDGFVELVLYGSYATGEYYAGSDIDLLLVHTGSTVDDAVDEVVQTIGDDRLHVISAHVSEDRAGDGAPDDLRRAIEDRSPVSGLDTVLPLTGEVSL